MKSIHHALTIIFCMSILAAGCSAPIAAPTQIVISPTETNVPLSDPSPTAPPTLFPTPEGITLVDGLDRTVQLSAPASKIISLAPSNTEILFALGAEGQIVGRDSFSDTPAEALSIPDIGGPYSGSNLELITDLQPDLILAAEINTPEQVTEFEKLGLTVFYLNNPEDIAGSYTNLEMVGKLIGREKEAADLVESLKLREAAINEIIATAKTQPRVFYEVDGTDPAKPWTTGPGSFMDTMITQAGGVNIGASLPIKWAQISQEELIIQNPEVILLGDHNFGMTAELVSARPGWNVIKAVEENRVLPFDDNLVSRPGPRLVDGLEALARAIHPELFE